MTVYRIKDWREIYENAETRKIKGPLRFVLVPNKQDGEGYGRIWRDPERGPRVFSAWILLLEIASKPKNPALRGWLLRDNGSPHTAESLAVKTQAPARGFQEAFEDLVRPEIGWIEEAPAAEYRKALEEAGIAPPPSPPPQGLPESPEDPGEDPGVSGDTGAERERKGTEGKGLAVSDRGDCQGGAAVAEVPPPIIAAASRARVPLQVVRILLGRGRDNPAGRRAVLAVLLKAAETKPGDPAAWVWNLVEKRFASVPDRYSREAKEILEPFETPSLPLGYLRAQAPPGPERVGDVLDRLEGAAKEASA